MKRKNRRGTGHHAHPIKFIALTIILIIVTAILTIFIWKENQKIIVCLDAGHGGKDVRLCVKQWETL